MAESERHLEEWRNSGVDAQAMLETQRSMTSRALATLERVYEYLISLR